MAASDVLKLDVPGFVRVEDGFGCGGKLGIDFGVFTLEGLAEEVAKAGGEWGVVDVEGVVFGVDELFFVRVPGEGGDDAVDVGMVLELAAPGVEDAGEASDASVGFGGGL